MGLYWRKLNPPQSTAVNYHSCSARMGPHVFLPYPCWHIDLLDFAWSCVCNHSSCECMSSILHHFEKTEFHSTFPILWPLNSFCSLFHNVPWVLGYVWYRCPINSCVCHWHLSTALALVVSLSTNHYSLQIILWSWRSGSVWLRVRTVLAGDQSSVPIILFGDALTHTNPHT